jgi:hypothetical protein
MTTLPKFIEDHSASLTVMSSKPRRTKDANGWEHNAYDVVLSGPCGSMLVKWRQGVALKGSPRLIDVLDSLRSDAMHTEETFEDWCAAYGYDSDSRKTEAIYNACKTQTAELQRVFGETFNVLIEDVEED